MLFGYVIEMPADVDKDENKKGAKPKYALLVYDMLNPDSPDEAEVGLASNIRASFKEPGRDVGVLHRSVAQFAAKNDLVIENLSCSRILKPTMAERVAQLERAALEIALCLQCERRIFENIIQYKDDEIQQLGNHFGELYMILQTAKSNGCLHIDYARKKMFGDKVSH